MDEGRDSVEYPIGIGMGVDEMWDTRTRTVITQA